MWQAPVGRCTKCCREFFFRSRIKHDEIFSDWLTRFCLVKRKVEHQGVELPPEIDGWLMLNRSGLSQEKRAHLINHVPSMEIDDLLKGLEKRRSTLDENRNEEEDTNGLTTNPGEDEQPSSK